MTGNKSLTHGNQIVIRPASASDLVRCGTEIRESLRRFKAETPLQNYGWYPYESLSALSIVADLFEPFYEQLMDSIQRLPAADLGCGDGEWAALFSRLGALVDAIDHRETNFNQMRGAEAVRNGFCPDIHIYDIDLDREFELPRRDYGLTMFLGTLYHLKSPMSVLETLAARSDWCLMSTRVFQVLPKTPLRIDHEPVAYLLGPREANNDPTNFWIFSPAGLRRLVERSGWTVVNEKRVGCTLDSDPVHNDADERMFMLLRSRPRHPDLFVRLLHGWHEVEQDQWRWTAKHFALQIVLPQAQPVSEFALRFTAPEVLFSVAARISLSCRLGDELLGTISCEVPETVEFRGTFPAGVMRGSALTLDFTVDSSFQPSIGDRRELGVIVPLLEPTPQDGNRIPFRIS